MFSYGPTHKAEQKQADQLEPTYSSSVRIWDVALRTCQKRWTIGRSGKRGSGISMLVAQQDDDNDLWYRRKLTFYEKKNHQGVIIYRQYLINLNALLFGITIHWPNPLQRSKTSTQKERPEYDASNCDGLVWFLCFNGISTFVGYLMPKPFS